jgi:hypothetical protein
MASDLVLAPEIRINQVRVEVEGRGRHIEFNHVVWIYIKRYITPFTVYSRSIINYYYIIADQGFGEKTPQDHLASSILTLAFKMLYVARPVLIV